MDITCNHTHTTSTTSIFVIDNSACSATAANVAAFYNRVGDYIPRARPPRPRRSYPQATTRLGEPAPLKAQVLDARPRGNKPTPRSSFVRPEMRRAGASPLRRI